MNDELRAAYIAGAKAFQEGDEMHPAATEADILESANEYLDRLQAEQGELPAKSLIRSRLFQQFMEQGFWHARSVDLVWRYNGEDVREEADWLKDLWYALRPAPVALLTNPHTGTPRDYRDVESDPAGLLITAPGEALRATSRGEGAIWRERWEPAVLPECAALATASHHRRVGEAVTGLSGKEREALERCEAVNIFGGLSYAQNAQLEDDLNAIAAALRRLQSEREGLVDACEEIVNRLEGWGKAYPLDVFPEPTKGKRDWLHKEKPGLMDCIAASMGRHMASCIASDIAKLRAAIDQAARAEGVDGG